MTLRPTSATRLIALLGDPVAHSRSPAFQNAGFRAAGVDGVYLALRCASEQVPGLLRGIALAGGGGNVTVPHKEVAARSVDRATEAVARTGACNTYWCSDGVVWGDNTDVAAVSDAVLALTGSRPAGARVLLLGAGGAARAALAALAADRASEVVLLNRTPERAQAVAARFADTGMPVRIVSDAAAVRGESFDLAINSTSLGLHASDPLPLPLEGGPVFGAALDLVYATGGTAWVAALQQRGVRAADGLEMLLLQGAAAFERWWNVPAPIDAMRRALEEAVSG